MTFRKLMSLFSQENFWSKHYLNLSLWFWFLGSEPTCFASIRVPRNSVSKVHVMGKLKINCTINRGTYCWENITTEWCKVDYDSECKPFNYSNNITKFWMKVNTTQSQLFLIFHNISMQDAGLYRCRIQSPMSIVSHSINVTVTGKHTILIYTVYSIYFMYALKEDINTDNLTNTANQMLW